MPGSRKAPEAADVRATARRVLEIEAKAIADLASRLDGAFERAAELLLDCQGRVVVTGMGKSGIVAQKIAATLSSTGTPSFFMHPAEALHGDLGMLVRGDVVIALSNSGETEEIVRLLELIRRLGAAIVGMSGDPGSTLARFADVHLHVGVDREACPLDLVPTASTTAALALGDALAVAVYARRGFSAHDFARVHPGGRLGRRLLQVGQIMHAGESVPRVRSGASMADAVAEMSVKRLGMTCVVDGEGRLMGVLTDGDLRRRLLRMERPLLGKVDEAMTSSPVTIAPSALAAEALRAMEDRRITSLAVVDEGGRLQGVIQIHDLWRTELF
ncbi:MAG TPA: KpsF/GutQ family sugar-phosphate isomerase [Candidatus Polarisedimenticolaceae bacterium]|nr:KpsF/GutQ family sugar-phosphate isomerase [Candidatus Polarisedimenticolaceae bacterium]